MTDAFFSLSHFPAEANFYTSPQGSKLGDGNNPRFKHLFYSNKQKKRAQFFFVKIFNDVSIIFGLFINQGRVYYAIFWEISSINGKVF